MDPPRPEVKEAVMKCKLAGIKPVMITGDHKTTAAAIGKEIGLMDNNDIALTGQELDSMNDIELKNKLENMLSENGKKFLMDFKAKNSTKGVYYKLPIDSIEFINKMNCKEILFSTIYFTKIPCTIWGNYNNKFPIFYKSENDLTNYKNIAQKYNLIIE